MTEEDLEIERQHVREIERSTNYPVLDMIKYITTNYKGQPNYFKDKNGEFKISSYKYQLIGHNASGFDNAIVLNSLPKEYTDKNKKIIEHLEDF